MRSELKIRRRTSNDMIFNQEHRQACQPENIILQGECRPQQKGKVTISLTVIYNLEIDYYCYYDSSLKQKPSIPRWSESMALIKKVAPL